MREHIRVYKALLHRSGPVTRLGVG
jgi:hypothetical protein